MNSNQTPLQHGDQVTSDWQMICRLILGCRLRLSEVISEEQIESMLSWCSLQQAAQWLG